ncbi:hypothetical protein niasHT_024440 [Heterodera trifolii]|uniref:Transcription initiation factor TFIID subunit 8 n=1 Tax=Heterodera trifolii TaxID=157864 RepID=A0ABD2JYF9_9BILA
MTLPTNLVESGCQSNFNSILPYQVYRRILRHCAASICNSIGFDTVQNGSLEALAFLFHQFFSNTCQSSRKLCEHTGRSLVNAGDVLMAMVNEGRPELADFDTFLDTVKHTKPHTFSLLPQSPTIASPVLRISEPLPLPSYYPNFLPPFPEPHTYVRSEVRDGVDTNYEIFRRLDAQNKHDWEESLIRFAITEHPTMSVFPEPDDIPHFCFILLPFDEPRPYLSALLTDDADQTVDDEQHNDDYFARILTKEMDEDDGAMEGGEEGGAAGGRNSTAALE